MLTDALQVMPRLIDGNFFIGLLDAFPDAICAVTQNIVTGELVGVKVHRTQAGVQVVDPWTDKPVTWQDIDGVPHHSKSGGHSTGSYRSRFVSHDELKSLLS